MTVPYYLLLALGAAILYAVSALYIKRALHEGAGVMRCFCVNSWIMGVCFMPLMLLQNEPVPWENVHHPAIVALLFFSGNLLTFFAIRVGDVSLVTPILGIKVMMVALCVVWVTGDPLPPEMWIAAILTTVAVLILGRTDIKVGKKFPIATLLTLASAVCFSLCDVFGQEWSKAFGGFAFLSVLFFFVAIFAFATIPFFRTPLKQTPKAAWKWMIGAGAFTAAQALLMSMAIVFFYDATGVNVVYSSRGLWSIVLVWFVGHWFGNVEHESGRKTFLIRFAGALLMSVAILLAVKAASG